MGQLRVQDGGTNVASSVATEAGREAMFRQGVHNTLKVASNVSGAAVASLAQSFQPREFVCGLSRALGIGEDKAIKVVHAAIAADARGRLLDISASRRKGDLESAGISANALIRILQVFPLPYNAAEASLVGAALQNRMTLPEMEYLLKQLVCFIKFDEIQLDSVLFQL